MELIGLTGPRENDRMVVARRLTERHNFAQLRFDDPARDMLGALLQLGRERIDALLLERRFCETPLPETGSTPLQFLHSLMTWGRRSIGPDLWINLLRQRLAFIAEELAYEYAGIVISDVRFDNEARFVREQGVLVHVARPDPGPLATIPGDGVKFQYRDQILLNLGADFIARHTDHLVQAVCAQRVA